MGNDTPHRWDELNQEQKRKVERYIATLLAQQQPLPASHPAHQPTQPPATQPNSHQPTEPPSQIATEPPAQPANEPNSQQPKLLNL